MPTKKAASPQQVAIMAVASVLAVAGSSWSISNALAPPPGLPQPANPPAGSAASPAAPTQAATSAAPMGQAAPAISLSAQREEALLSPGANPFASTARPASSPGPSLFPMPAAPPGNTALPPQIASAPPSVGLPTIRGLQGRPQDIQAPPMSVRPAVAPELVGTLLGDRPSGVFRVDGHLTIVSVGDSIEMWRVLSVHHGEAVLKSGGRTVRVRVGTPSASASTPRQGVFASSSTPGEGVRPSEQPQVAEGSDPKAPPARENAAVVSPFVEGGEQPAGAPAAWDAGATERERPPQAGTDPATASAPERSPQQSEETPAVPTATPQPGSAENVSPFTAAADSSVSARSTDAENPFARHSIYLARVGARGDRPSEPSRPAEVKTVALALPADDSHRRQARPKQTHRLTHRTRRHPASGRRHHRARRHHRRHHAQRRSYSLHRISAVGYAPRFLAWGLR